MVSGTWRLFSTSLLKQCYNSIVCNEKFVTKLCRKIYGLKNYMIKANGLSTNIEVKAKKVSSFSFHSIFFGGGINFLGEEKEKMLRILGKRNCRWDLKGVKYSNDRVVWNGKTCKSIKGDIINVIKREPVKQ